MDKDFILHLYSRPETVFTVDEMAQLFPKLSSESLRNRLYYFTKVGKLTRLHAGVYAKEGYNSLELVNKLYTPSYISLETVLAKEGVVFQYYETVFAVSYVTRELIIKDVTIQYRRIKESILTNTMGVEQKEGYYIASLERAFLDAIYIYKNYHFDNLGTVNWESIFTLKKIYNNTSFEKRVEAYYQRYKDDYAKH